MYKSPLHVPEGVDFRIEGGLAYAKGPAGEDTLALCNKIHYTYENGVFQINPVGASLQAMAGTTRALLSNLLQGVHTKFVKNLKLIGVGYRAILKGQVLALNLGFSHPISYRIPKDVSITTPSTTDIVVSGIDKQKVGQVAAEIRRFRPPEPYKGKGVRYTDEVVLRKEVKKK